MIDRYTKILLTVIAVNMTIMTGWGAVKVLVPEVRAYDQSVWISGGRVEVENTDFGVLKVKCTIGC